MGNVLAPVAYAIPAAADATGFSESTIRRAVDAGELVVHYLHSKPVILVEDLRAWVEAAPTERPK